MPGKAEKVKREEGGPSNSVDVFDWDSQPEFDIDRRADSGESCGECGTPAWLTFGGTQLICPLGHISLRQRARQKAAEHRQLAEVKERRVPSAADLQAAERARAEDELAAELAADREKSRVRAEVGRLVSYLRSIGSPGAERFAEELTRRYHAWLRRFEAGEVEGTAAAWRSLDEAIRHAATFRTADGLDYAQQPHALPPARDPSPRRRPSPSRPRPPSAPERPAPRPQDEDGDEDILDVESTWDDEDEDEPPVSYDYMARVWGQNLSLLSSLLSGVRKGDAR